MPLAQLVLMGAALTRRRLAERSPEAAQQAEATGKAALLDQAAADALLARVRASRAEQDPAQ